MLAFRIALFIILLLPFQAAGSDLLDEVRGDIRAHLLSDQQPPVLWLDGTVALSAGVVQFFYQQRDMTPAWVGELGLKAGAVELVEVLRSSGEQGLCSDDYHLPLIETLLQLHGDALRDGVPFNPHFLAILDLLLSDAFLRYVADLRGETELGDPARELARHKRLALRLTKALDEQRIGKSLQSLVPVQPGYRALREQLGRLRQLSASGGWPWVEPGKILRPGARDERLKGLRTRLFLSGDLTDIGAWLESDYGPETRKGVTRFQQRHGLDPDGVLGPLTLAELNVPVEARIRQVELNLERWRHLPDVLGDRHIRVNVADFRLEVFEYGKPVLTMPVVVGTPYRQTPVFSAQMSYVEFAPFWYVPETILREDKLPLIRRDPGWLERNHYEILGWLDSAEVRLDARDIDWSRIDSRNFPGTLRMRPGPWNPLGRVKFIFPNRYAIYLHDTNEQALFGHDVRLFSSGCIRIERPLDLAQYLLEKLEGWDCQRIQDAMEGGATLRVDLPEKLPVHLVYLTAWVDHAGQLQYRKDVYFRDAELELARQRFNPVPEAAADLVKADFSASEMPR